MKCIKDIVLLIAFHIHAAFTYRLCSVYRVHPTPPDQQSVHMWLGHGWTSRDRLQPLPTVTSRITFANVCCDKLRQIGGSVCWKKKSILLKMSSNNRVSGSIAGSTFAPQLILSSRQIIFEVHGFHIPWNCEPSRAIMHNSGWQNGLSVKNHTWKREMSNFLVKLSKSFILVSVGPIFRDFLTVWLVSQTFAREGRQEVVPSIPIFLDTGSTHFSSLSIRFLLTYLKVLETVSFGSQTRVTCNVEYSFWGGGEEWRPVTR